MHLPAASPVRRSSAAKPRSPRRSRVVGFGIVGAVAGSALAAVASAVLFLGPGELTAAPHHAMPTYWAQSTAASGWIGPNNSGIGPAWAWREAMALRLASGGNDGATDVQGGALTTIAMRSSDERSSGTVEPASAAGDRHHLVGSETASRLELAIDLVIEPGPVRRVRLPLRDPAPADAEPLATIIIENVPLAIALSIGQRTTPTTWLVSPSQLDDLYLVLADDAPRETSLRIAALERSGRTVAQFALKVAFISPAPFAAPFSGETTASIAPSSADQARPPNVASATGPVISHHPVAKLASVQPVKSAKPERPARTARLQPTSATNAQVDLPHEPAPPRPIIIKRVPPADAPEPEVVLAPAKDRKPMRLGVGPDQPEPRAAANESAVIVEQPRRNWYQKSVDWAPRESIR